MYFYELPAVNGTDAEVLDRMRVRELVEYDRYCNDYQHRAQQNTLWDPQGTVFTTWFRGTYADFTKAHPTPAEHAVEPEHIPGLGVMVQHRPAGTFVWLMGDRAVAELLFQLCFRTPLGEKWVDIECWARMHYRCEKRNGEWKIVYMEGIYEKDTMSPVLPGGAPLITAEQLKQYRPINWNMGYRRDRFEGGADLSGDWAGADRPETIERLYRGSSEFLGLTPEK